MNADTYSWLRLDSESSTSPSEQVRALIATAAASGKLPVGSRLPPIRTLAHTLGLAATTVAKSYRELERAGVVETRSRAGTVVVSTGDDAHARAADAAAKFAVVVRAQGLSGDDAAALALAAYNGLP